MSSIAATGTARDAAAPPRDERFDVAVIGAGPAGTAAAIRAAELGARVVVLESSDRLGGTCVNTGCVPTRVFAKTARLMRDVRAASAYGITTHPEPIDWHATVARVHERVEAVRGIKAEARRFETAGIALIQEGRARFADPHTLLLDSGRRVEASTILICVGGHSRLLPIPGAELATVPEHVLNLPDLPGRVAIIGAGNTGVQLATVFDSFGAEVVLLDLAPRILMPSDADVAAAVTASFVAQGIHVHTGIAGVSSLARGEDGGIVLTWADGAGERAEAFDAVVMATGWPADVDDLGLENAGV